MSTLPLFSAVCVFTTIHVVICLFSFPVFANNDDQDPVYSNITLSTRSGSPYNLGEASEFVYQRVTCVLDSINYHYEIKSYPWKRAQKYAAKNITNGFFPASTNADRDLSYTKSLPINHGYIYWVSLRPNQVNPKNIHQNQKLVGTVRGTNASQWAKNNGFKVYEVNNQKMLTSMLNSKRIDVILTSRESLDSSEHPNWKEKLSLLEAYSRTQYVFFSKIFLSNNPNFLNAFNAEIQACVSRHPFR